MKNYKIIEVKESIFKQNDQDANLLRKKLKDQHTFLLNLMASPGAGKTTTLIQILSILKSKLKIGVMEADIDSDVDAKKILENTGIDSIQLHTGGMCHLTAHMTEQGIDALDDHYDFLVLENVGNLVCPAEFDTGSHLNAAILSVPEGDDKPLKYPLMFQVCDLVIINKIDVAPYFDFDFAKAKENILMRNPNAKIFCISAKTGEGCQELANYLLSIID